MSAPQHLTSLSGLRVFISYARGGLAHTWAERLEQETRQRGAEVFRDESDIAAGDVDWYRRIEQALVGADVVACIVGHDTDNCRWQTREILRADQLAIPIVALRIAPVSMPFSLIEKQPVEWRSTEPGDTTLQAIAHALRAAAPHRTPAATTQANASAVPAAQREREESYLSGRIYGELSGHEERYVDLRGEVRQAPTVERAIKGLRLRSTAMLRAMSPAMTEGQATPAPVPCQDVLNAYLALPHQRIRRLAVLGEPGAGKSFSLERLAVHLARHALREVAAPVPVLVRLGLWTREADTLQHFIETQLGKLGHDFVALRAQRRAVLMLDGLNEIPTHQRALKAQAVRQMAEDERFAAVIVSCRQQDFVDDYALPFDQLTLEPLSPMQVHDFLHRVYRESFGPQEGQARAEKRFWQIAGGQTLEDVWRVWERAGASFEQFWTLDEEPKENPNISSATTYSQMQVWKESRQDPRSLLGLASNPFMLMMMAAVSTLPNNRAELFQIFLDELHARELAAYEQRHEAQKVPDIEAWRTALSELAQALQGLRAEADAEPGAGTSLHRAAWPASLTPTLLRFSEHANVLQLAGDDVRFTHQLLQESLASRVLLRACTDQPSAARGVEHFWPSDRWWQASGWEVVAELAAESCASDLQGLVSLMSWLQRGQPEVAARAWRRAGAPELPPALLRDLQHRWAPLLCDAAAAPSPAMRAAIGRALAAFDLDHRAGTGLRADGLPDIEWVSITGQQPWVYQGEPHKPLPPYDLARHPITNGQFEAFLKAGGCEDARWWQGMLERMGPSQPAEWSDANAPRETVSWFEATAYCRWLAHATGDGSIGLPTERQWERAAAGLTGSEYPWGANYEAGRANCDEPGSEITNGTYLQRTSAVGIYPNASPEGIHDLSGNVWEWCADRYDPSDQGESASRVLRGGSWFSLAWNLRAADRDRGGPGGRSSDVGFRVCRSSPIE